MSSRFSHARGRGKIVPPVSNHLIGLEFEKNVPLFPLLAEIELLMPTFFTEVHLLVELLQILSLALLPYHNWGFALHGITRALHFSHVPLYDSTILGLGFIGTLVVGCVAVAMMLFCVVVAVSFVLRDDDVTNVFFGLNSTRVVRLVMYAFSSFLFVPLVQNLLSISFCKQEGAPSELFWYPSESCASGVTAFSLAITVVGLVLLTIATTIMNTLAFDSNPMSRHYFSRAHALWDMPLIAFKVISCAVMHYCVATDKLVYHAVWMAVASLLLGIAFVMLPPHFRKVTTQIRVTGLFLCTLYAILAACSHAPVVRDQFLSNDHSDVSILLATFPLFAWFIWRFVALARTSTIFVQSMEQLHEGHISHHITHFPRNLPEEELLFDNNAELFGELMEGVTVADANEDRDGDREYHFTFPYVDYITFDMDVELASRFCIYFRKFTQLDLSKFQVAYTATLFMKGVQAYRDSSFIRLAFANFLMSHAGKPRLALQQVHVFRCMEATLAERYQGYKLFTRLSSILHLGQSTRLEALSRAKRRHREALHHTMEFWQLLLTNEDVDKNALSNSTRAILSGKEDVLRIYTVLLTKNPSNLDILACYTTFVDTLLNDPEATLQCLQCLREGRELKTANTMRGAKVKGDTGTLTQIPLDFDDQDGASSSQETEGMRRVSWTLFLLTLTLLLILGGFLAMYIVMTNETTRSIKATVGAGKLRGLASQCAVAAYSLYQSTLAGSNTSSTVFDLLGLQQDFNALHNELTLGDWKPKTTNQVSLYRSTVNTIGNTNLTVNVWTLGTLVSVALKDIALHPTSSDYLSWVINDLPTDVSDSFNETAMMWENAYSDAQTTLQIWTGVLLGLALITIGVGCIVVFYNIHKIERVRADIFSLFTLIPRKALRKLFRETRKRYTELDVFFNLSTRKKLVKLIGADQNDQEKLQLNLEDNHKHDDAAERQSQHSASEVSSRHSASDSVASSVAPARGETSEDRSTSKRRRGRRSGQSKDPKRNADDNVSSSANVGSKADAQFSADAAFSVTTWVVISILAALLIALVSMMAYASTLPDDYRGGFVQQNTLFQRGEDVVSGVRELLDAARGFVFTGASRYFERFITQVSANGALWADFRRSWLHALPSDMEDRRMTATKELLDGVLQHLSIVMSLASATPTYGAFLPTASFSATYLSTYTWPQEEGLKLVKVAPYWGVSNARTNLIDGSDVDQAKTAAVQLSIAKAILSAEPLMQLVRELTVSVRNMTDVSALTDIRTTNRTRLFGLTLASTIASFVAMFLCFFLCYTRFNSNTLRRLSLTLTLVLLTAATCAAFALTLTALVRGATDKSIKPFPDILTQARDNRVAWTDAIQQEIDYPRLFLASGDQLWNEMYRQVFFTDFSPAVVSPISDLGALDASAETVDVENRLDTVRLVNLVNSIKRLDGIAMVLIQSVTSSMPQNFMPANIVNATYLSSISWDFVNEPDYHLTVARYANSDSRVFYSTRTADLAASTATRSAIATATLFSHRSDDIMLGIRQIIDGVFQRVITAALTTQDSHATFTKSIVVGSFSLFASGIGLLMIMTLTLFFRYSRGDASWRDGASTAPSAASNTAAEVAAPFWAYAFVAALAAAAAAIVIAQVKLESSVAVRLNSVTERTWEGASAMFIAQRMQLEPSYFVEGQEEARRMYRVLLDKTTMMQYQRTSSYFSVAMDSQQDSLSFSRFSFYSLLSFFGAATATSTTTTNFGSSSSGGDAATTPSPSSATASIDAANNLYLCNATRGNQDLSGIARGVSLVYGSQLMTLLERLSYAAPADVNVIASEMQALYEPMIMGLTLSTNRFQTYETDRATLWQTVVIALVAAALALMIILHVVVFNRFVRFLSEEESSARLMLRIIPQDVREGNKQIQSYLESGRVKQTADDLNSAIASMSTLPVIAIDQKGIIMRFTQAAENVFGYTSSEVVGLNVSVLMPEEYAKNHDNYLSTYRRTKIKHVVDTTRRLKGKKKNGDLVPLELRVMELKFGDESVYIGFAKDISSELDLTIQDQLNKYVLDMSRDPIVTIDSYGQVVNVNQAVTTVFGYTRDEMLRENVKMLMPSDVALHHDGYLSRYRETGVKHIIDSTRQVQGQRKNGEIFQANVTVRDIRQEGEAPLFIGFVVDVTEAHEAAMLNEVNDIISDLSPVPIIAINDKGVFVKFSRAASQLFQYSKEELVGRGQNIQILVPPKFGDHNRFLKAYFTTGVAKVVGSTRNIIARKRDKTVFPAMLTLREIRKESMQPVFLGYISDITQTLQLEEAGKLASEIMRFSMIPIVVTSMSGIIIGYNEAAENTFGYRADEVLNRNVKMLIPSHVAVVHDNIISTYLKTREKNVVGLNRVVQALRKNGEAFPVDLSLREVPESEHGEGCFFAYMRDVTSHRETLQQFMINDCITQLSTVPIVAISSKGLIESFSPAAEDCFGYSSSEVIGENIKMLMIPEIAEKHDEYLRRYRKTGIKTIIDSTRVVFAKRRDGSTFQMEVSVREIRKEGTQSSFVGYCRDTSRDQLLENQKELGATIRDLSTIPIVLINDHGIISYVNDAFRDEFGYHNDADIFGQNVKVLLPGEIAVHHDDYLAAYRAKGPGAAANSSIVGKVRRLMAVRKDGSTVEVEAKVAEIRSERSGSLQFVGFVRNLATQLKLEQANYTIDTITNLSLIPIIAIDHRGLVIKFSRAAEVAFGYTAAEVLGNNVKLLMPEEVAEKHDSFLRTYLKTHVKTVIGALLRQEGRRKNGTRFPLELSIKEIVKNGQNPLFIGYVRDASQDTALERAMQLSTLVTQLSPIPIIVINRQGIIQTFNTAACDTFEFAAEEALGQDVSIIMAGHDAAYHTRYLKTYAKTHIKSAIDNVKKRTAKRKSGQLFNVEVSVKEIIPSSKDEKLICYLGFIRDLTSVQELQQAGVINDTIANMSQVPLIVITSSGTVMKFSASAEQVFGYSSQDVIGKNVKMLMPQHIADHHDEYLQLYRKKPPMPDAVIEKYVRGRRRTGEEFPAKLTLREVRKQGQEPMFLGYLTDMSSKFEIIRRQQIMEASIDLCSSPIISISTEGTVRSFNEAAEDCFGYTKGEIIGNNIKVLMPRKTAEFHDGFLANYLKTGVKHVVDRDREVTAKRKNGKRFSAVISVREITENGDHFFVGYVRDRSNVAALEQASVVNDAIISMSVCSVIGINSVGEITKFSPAAENLFGYKAVEVLGRNVSLFMTEPYRSQHDSYLEAYTKTKVKKVIGKTTQNLRAQRKDGTTFNCELTVSEIALEAAESGFIALINDVTDEINRQAEFAIAKVSEEMTTRALVAIDGYGTIMRVNRSLSQMFGYEQAQLLGKNVKILMPVEIAAQHDGFLRTYRETGIKHVIDTQRRVNGCTKQGRLFEVELNIKELKLDSGKLFIAWVDDVSQRKELSIAASLSNVVLELVPAPLVVINGRGIVLHFNRAAESIFEFDAVQIIGKNVKLMMPPDVAKVHDDYLTRYAQTGEKHIIDGLRDVEGETKTGRRLRLRISVREVKKQGNDTIFIGFLLPLQ